MEHEEKEEDHHLDRIGGTDEDWYTNLGIVVKSRKRYIEEEKEVK